jgi:hypothetical protein
MHIHDIFSVNLRQACKRFDSISDVARRVGINRQQFNRYLSGENIPNRRTIGRLAKFLNIDESELFSIKDHKSNVGGVFSASSYVPGAQAMAIAGGNQKVLLPGYYCCYFPLQGTDQFLVKSILKIAKKGEHLFFSRHTIFRSATFPKSTLAQGKHRGVVLANDSDVYLLAINTLQPVHLSMIAIERQQIAGSSVLYGLSITRGTTAHFSSRVCLQHVGSSLEIVRHHLLGQGIIPVTSHEIDPTIGLMMTAEQNPEQKLAQLSLPNFEDMMLTQRSNTQIRTRTKAIV